MKITALMVKELRDKTGVGMMDCKRALVEADGDFQKAIDILREKGLAKAAKKADRVAAEGAVVSYISDDQKVGDIVEVNCETDFVGSNEQFLDLANEIAKQCAAVNPADVDALMESKMDNGQSVKDVVTEAVSQLGENIKVRRFSRFEAKEGKLYSYIHAGGKIGVIVEMKGGDEQLGKDISMQIAAANPSYVTRDEVPAAEVEHEKAVLTEEAHNEGKPEKILEKIVLGRLNKFYQEVCLLDQPFIKDEDMKISKLLKSKQAEVIRFSRFFLGEGIEKKEENLAEEVAKQIKK